jgi:hypothetical protein
MASKGGEWAKTNQPHPAAFYGPQKGFAMFSRLRDRLEQLESQLEPIQLSAATMGEALSAQQGPRPSCPSRLRYSPSPARPSRVRPLLSVDPPLAVAQLLVRALRLVVSRARPSGPAPPPQASAQTQRRSPMLLQGADKRDRGGEENTQPGPCRACVETRRNRRCPHHRLGEETSSFVPRGARLRHHANRLPVFFLLTFADLAGHSTNLRSDQNAYRSLVLARRAAAKARARRGLPATSEAMSALPA